MIITLSVALPPFLAHLDTDITTKRYWHCYEIPRLVLYEHSKHRPRKCRRKSWETAVTEIVLIDGPDDFIFLAKLIK